MARPSHLLRCCWLLLLLGSLGECSVPACAQTSAEPAPAADAAGVEFFERKVRPLLHEHCLACHKTDSGEPNGDLLLDSAAAIRQGGSRGPAIIAGRPDESLLLEALRYTDADLQMPPDGKLSAEVLAVFEQWIARGAPLPADTGRPRATGSQPIDWAAARTFWAFQPLATARPPLAPGASWGTGPIDAFTLQQLTAHGLRPNPEAERATLGRRLSFDLLGLPPAREELAEFEHDSRPDAYERFVDRLLASPQLGERWARFWLDMVRYADAAPNWLNSAERAWLYRDWVIRALNEDLPYDRFVTLQLAADFVDDAAPADLAALGMLGLSPTRWKELRLAPVLIETIVAEEWEERIDMVSRTLLGLNVACARCHDHKLDPITMQDYYALAGVFASSQLADRPLLPPDAAAQVRAARREHDELQKQLEGMKDKNSPEAQALQEQLAALRRNTPHFDEPWAHVVEESSVYVVPDGEDATRLELRPGEPRDVPLFLRGNPATKGDPVPRRFLQVLSDDAPRPFTHGSGRLDLAEGLLTEARALTARVIVNRVWRQHFGKGLVRTPSDFGSQGERPTHPELLDYLAGELIRHGWSLKWLHREIVLSATYRQSSQYRAEPQGVDPENRWLWRMNRRRLEVETWRDTILSSTGQLEFRMYGPPLELTSADNRRRTIYGRVVRQELNDLLRLYDFPDPESHSPARDLTTTPLQQLFVLNSPFMRTAAAAFARHLAPLRATDDWDPVVDAAHAGLFQRSPAAAELAAAREFLQTFPPEEAEQALTYYLHALLGSNAAMFVD